MFIVLTSIYSNSKNLLFDKFPQEGAVENHYPAFCSFAIHCCSYHIFQSFTVSAGNKMTDAEMYSCGGFLKNDIKKIKRMLFLPRCLFLSLRTCVQVYMNVCIWSESSLRMLFTQLTWVNELSGQCRSTSVSASQTSWPHRAQTNMNKLILIAGKGLKRC